MSGLKEMYQDMLDEDYREHQEEIDMRNDYEYAYKKIVPPEAAEAIRTAVKQLRLYGWEVTCEEVLEYDT